MNPQNIIITAVLFIIGILLIRSVSKIIFNKEFILYELREKCCKGDDEDQAKCNCIINPLLEEFSKKYSREEIQELSKNKAKSIKEILKTADANKAEIKTCLKENKSESLWKDFVKDVKKIDVKDKLKQLFQERDSTSIMEQK
jgi:hypothetical protein